MRPGHTAVAVLSLALVLGSCSTSDPVLPSGTPTVLAPLPAPSAAVAEQATDPAYAAFYGQSPAWADCGDGLQCASLTVPVDWQRPEGEALALAVVRRPASDGQQRQGSLLVNPGGPGASGTAYVRDYGSSVVSPALQARYDLVGFDPRGTGGSAPVDCLDDPAMDGYLAYDVEAGTPQGLAELAAVADGFAAGCARSAGPLLAHLDTVSAARDLDALRDAVGEERLSYLGKSYGTLLGAQFADLFPQRTGRLVLDGAMDPASGYDEVVLGQATGMEGALNAYLTACLAGRTSGQCPLRGSLADATGQVRAILDQAEQSPLTTDDDRDLTVTLAVSGIITPLYDDAAWPVLDRALAGALQGDGTGLLALADVYADRGADGTYASNLLEAFTAVSCLDYRVDDDPAAMAALAQELTARSPTLGPYLAYGEVTCGRWPVPPVRPQAPLRAAGAAPILVVGTTGDPATPYAWAQALADELESGRLLTWQGEGHTAYARGSQCVDDAVDAYLLDGVLPGDGATCAG